MCLNTVQKGEVEGSGVVGWAGGQIGGSEIGGWGVIWGMITDSPVRSCGIQLLEPGVELG